MVRFKNRFLVFRVDTANDADARVVGSALRQGRGASLLHAELTRLLLEVFGDAVGAPAAATMRIKVADGDGVDARGAAVGSGRNSAGPVVACVRCDRDWYRQVWACLSFMTRIAGCPVAASVIETHASAPALLDEATK